MGGFPVVPPTPYQNPVLDELDRLSPQAKTALARAHQSIASVQAPPDVAATPMQPAQIPGAPQRLASPPSYTPKPLRGNPSSPVGVPPPMTADQQAHTDERNRLLSSGSGVSQIKSPWARVPLQIADAIGGAFLPGLEQRLPGTEGRHEFLVNRSESAVKGDEAQREAEGKLGQDAAQTAHTQAQVPLTEAQTEATRAEVPLREAQTEGEQAKTAALPGTLKTEKELKEAQTGKTQAETQKMQADAAPLANTDHLNGMLEQRFQVLNPGHTLPPSFHLQPNATKADYDLVDKALEATEKATGTKAQQDQTAELRREGMAMAAQNHADSIAMQRQNHQDAQGARGEVKMFVPGPDGQYKLQTLHAGDVAPQGSISATGMNAMNTPTTQQRNVAAQASLVHEQTPETLAQIGQLKDKIGPMAGRWNEFMQGKVGANDPQMADLRANLLMYSSAVALMHARGRLPENLREEFDHAINAPNQTADNLTATIKRIDDWTEKNMHAMGGGQRTGEGAAATGGNAPAASEPTLEEINAEVERRKKAK